jgi:hypothetical protein
MNFLDNYNNFKNKFESIDISTISDEELEKLSAEVDGVFNEYNNLEQVVKRNCNSLYGTSASIYFSLCDFDVAEDITILGKHFLVLIDKNINRLFASWDEHELVVLRRFYPGIEKLDKLPYKPGTRDDICLYGDTDSRYIDLERIYNLMGMTLPASDEELVDFSCFMMKEFINGIIKTTIEEECDKRNMRKGYMRMAHEVTTRKTIFRAKKNYVMVVIYNNGKLLPVPKLKFKGVEMKRGGMSPRAKKILSVLIDKYLFNNYTSDMLRTECLKIFQHVRTTSEKDVFYNISSVSGLKAVTIDPVSNKYIIPGTHIQAQVAVSWFNFIRDNKLESEYKKPFEGQKMNYYYCDPSSGIKVIGVPDDVSLKDVKNLPKPDLLRMFISTIVKPLLRYIYDKDEIDETDAMNFLNGIKPLNVISRSRK